MATAAVARDSLDGLELGLCSMLVLVGLRLVAVVSVVGGGEGDGGLGQGAGLEDAAAVISGAVVVEALADDLAAFDDDTAMAIVERREMGLLDTEIEVEIRLHGCLVWCWLIWQGFRQCWSEVLGTVGPIVGLASVSSKKCCRTGALVLTERRETSSRIVGVALAKV